MAREYRIKVIEDIRKSFIEEANSRNMSGYAIGKYMKDKAMPNSSGARLYLGGKFSTITTQTMLNVCEALSLDVLLVPRGGKTKAKTKERTPWDWKNSRSAVDALMEKLGSENSDF